MDISDSIKKLTRIKETDATNLFDKTKGTFTSAAIGGAAGFLIGYNRNWNLLFSTVIGATAAALVSNYFVKVKD